MCAILGDLYISLHALVLPEECASHPQVVEMHLPTTTRQQWFPIFKNKKSYMKIFVFLKTLKNAK